MKLLKWLVPKWFSLWGLLWNKNDWLDQSDRANLDEEAMQIHWLVSVLPWVVWLGMKDLRAFNIYTQWIDSIWDTMAWVEAQIWATLIWTWKVEEELINNGIVGEQSEKILSVVSEWLKAQLLHSRIEQQLEAIDNAINLIQEKRQRLTEIQSAIDEANKALTDGIDAILERTSSDSRRVLSGQYMHTLNPANQVFWTLQKSSAKISRMRNEVEWYQVTLSNWINQRLESVEKMREETWLTLEMPMILGWNSSN